MTIKLSQVHFEHLVSILAEHGEWASVQRRIDFMNDVLAGSNRKMDILGTLDLDGTPRGTAIRTIERLSNFGQDKPGRESLGVLINKLLVYIGGGNEANFLKSLFSHYQFNIQPAATQMIEDWHGKETNPIVEEKIIGENTLRDICFLEELLTMSSSVVRISTPLGLGTGFIIAPEIIITNNHVIPNQNIAHKSEFTFNYQLDRFGNESKVETVRAKQNGIFHTSPVALYNANSDELDYSIIQTHEMPRQFNPLTLRATAPSRDARLTIIQHPGGTYKKISMQNNFVEYVDQYVVQYTTSTEPGSSGSPVIDDDFNVIALHHAGGNLTEPLTKRRYLRNEAIRISVILEDLKLKMPEIYKLINQ